MTYLSIRFARLAALSLFLTTAGCTINTYESSGSSSGGEATKDDKPKPKKKKKKPEDEPAAEAKPEKEKPEKEKPKPEKEKPKPEKEKPEVEKPASKPDKPKDPVVEKPKDEPKEPPKDDKPAPPPQPDRSKIVLPIKIELAALEKEIDGLIPKTDKKDWTQVTKGDESPKAELKYELWRDPIKLELDGRTFHITVPVRYAATIRAQVKNPLNKDWFWIAKDETWGTKADPQHLTARFEAKLSVTDDWKIVSDLKLVKLEHGKPPSGEICKTVAIKVCVEKSSIADEVREGIDKRLEPKLKKALEQVDAKVERAFDVKKRASSIWSEVQQSKALPWLTETWLVVQPTAAGIDGPVKDGSDVRIDLAIEGKISVQTGKRPKPTPVPLPKLSKVEGEPGFHVIADLKIPRSALNDRLEQALKGLTLKDRKSAKYTIVRSQLTVSADETHPRRLTLTIAVDPASDHQLELQGNLTYDEARQRLSVENFEITAASRSAAAARLSGLDLDALEKRVSEKASWSMLDQADPLKKTILEALDASLRGNATVRGQLKQVDIKKLELKPDVIEAAVIIGGELAVEVKR